MPALVWRYAVDMGKDQDMEYLASALPCFSVSADVSKSVLDEPAIRPEVQARADAYFLTSHRYASFADGDDEVRIANGRVSVVGEPEVSLDVEDGLCAREVSYAGRAFFTEWVSPTKAIKEYLRALSAQMRESGHEILEDEKRRYRDEHRSFVRRWWVVRQEGAEPVEIQVEPKDPPVDHQTFRVQSLAAQQVDVYAAEDAFFVGTPPDGFVVSATTGRLKEEGYGDG